MKMLRLVAGAAALSLAACVDEPLIPCAGEHACEVSGVDLALAIEVEFAADQPYVEQVGEHVVRPGDTILVHYRVINRGNAISSGGVNLYVRRWEPLILPIPSLRPGEITEGTFAFVTTTTPDLYTARAYVSTELVIDSAGDWYGYGDAVLNNNRTFLDALLAAPALRIETVVPDSIGASFEAVVRLTNESAVESGPVTIGFCSQADVDCPWEATWFSPQVIPSVPAGETIQAMVTVTLPPGMSGGRDPVFVGCAAIGSGVAFPVARHNQSCAASYWSTH